MTAFTRRQNPGAWLGGLDEDLLDRGLGPATWCHCLLEGGRLVHRATGLRVDPTSSPLSVSAPTYGIVVIVVTCPAHRCAARRKWGVSDQVVRGGVPEQSTAQLIAEKRFRESPFRQLLEGTSPYRVRTFR